MEVPRLETDRLVLRGFTVDDLDHVASLFADPRVMHFLGDGKPRSREHAHERLAATLYRWQHRRIPMWALIVKETGACIGRCGFAPYEETDQIELAYTLATAHWGKGYATEASRACLRHAFGELAWPRLIARTRPDNLASRRVLEKLGFRFDRDESDANGPAIFFNLTRELYVVSG